MRLLESLSSRKNLWLFAIIFIEGYAVLAAELLAIRLLVPFVGSGTEIISIIISAVLLPLAVGYHAGSVAYKREHNRRGKRGKKVAALRQILVRNIISVMVFFTFGLSYFFLEVFFGLLEVGGITSHLAKAAVYCAVFLVYPVYLLGQTMPIVSNYFSETSLSKATGTMLFFSTLGSFLGSVFSTLVLMMTIGVHNTVIVTLALLFLLVLVIKQKLAFEVLTAGFVLIFAVMLNQDGLFKKNNIHLNNAYSIISVHELEHEEGSRIMSVNRSASSKVANEPKNRFPYIQYIEDNFIYSYMGEEPLRVLVIGAGGFTMGLGDAQSHYTFVDIDPDIKEVSEKYFLRQELGKRKEFVAASARAFLRREKGEYDLIIIDAYTNYYTIPAECVTQEFFQAVKERLAPGGAVVANYIISPNMDDKFARRAQNTFASVFPQAGRQVIGNYSPWVKDRTQLLNNLFIYKDQGVDDRVIYRDDLNTYSIDKY